LIRGTASIPELPDNFFGMATGFPAFTQSSNLMSTDVTLVKPRPCSDLIANAQRPPVAQYSIIFVFMFVLSGKPTSFQILNSIRPHGTLRAPGTNPSSNSFSLRTSISKPTSF
jgi:hypothetical protein